MQRPAKEHVEALTICLARHVKELVGGKKCSSALITVEMLLITLYLVHLADQRTHPRGTRQPQHSASRERGAWVPAADRSGGSSKNCGTNVHVKVLVKSFT